MITPIQPRSGQWKESRPQVTVSGFAVDPAGHFPIFYRGPSVRSAKNCWALPSGWHECGYTWAEQLAIELKEELNLESNHTKAELVGAYENIAGVDDYHWSIMCLVIPVKTLTTLINKEPDKHTDIRLIHYGRISSEEFLGLNWAPHLGKFLRDYKDKLQYAIVNQL